MMAPLCKLHDVLHMFIMALTACPERGRHTNKLTEKSLERMLGRLFEKTHVLLQFLSQHCALSFTTSSTSPLNFFSVFVPQSSSVPAAPLSPFIQKGRVGGKVGSAGEKPLKGGRDAILCKWGKKG